jgi:hypothetical protein
MVSGIEKKKNMFLTIDAETVYFSILGVLYKFEQNYDFKYANFGFQLAFWLTKGEWVQHLLLSLIHLLGH